MKVFLQIGFFALAGAMLGGCTSQPKILYHAGDEAPPDFLAGPVGVLLTNVGGFSAKLSGSVVSSSGLERTVDGDLLGREGSLIYQPTSMSKGKRARVEGGMFFIWNEETHAGYVLNDPLQAYAPASGTAYPTNIAINTDVAVEETVNGHPCRRVMVTVKSSDGTFALFTVWQAKDAKHFPVRIEAPPGPGAMSLNVTDLHLELPPPQIFAPPEGFDKFDSPVTLMNELIVRQNAIAKRGEGAEIQLNPSGAPATPSWRPTTPQ